MLKEEPNLKIAFVLGTKAQFIKSKYVLKELIKHNMNLTIIDTGQHKEITKLELKDLNNQFKYVSFSNNENNISTVFQMFKWFLKIIFTKKKKKDLENIKVCMIHGDTLSTLIGLFIAKKHKMQVIHLESGLSSHKLIKPFPEEIIRRIVARFSDILVLDNKQSVKNTEKYSHKKKLIKISRNTVFDSIINSALKAETNVGKSLTVTVHRTENIYNINKLRDFVNLLIEIKNKSIFETINWFCHDITINALRKNNFENLLLKNSINLKNLLKHDLFVRELLSSKAIITDGGSIAEECSILGLKTAIWRDVVENKDYLNEKVILTNYDKNSIIKFLQNNSISSNTIDDIKKLHIESPSKELVKNLISIYN